MTRSNSENSIREFGAPVYAIGEAPVYSHQPLSPYFSGYLDPMPLQKGAFAKAGTSTCPTLQLASSLPALAVKTPPDLTTSGYLPVHQPLLSQMNQLIQLQGIYNSLMQQSISEDCMVSTTLSGVRMYMMYICLLYTSPSPRDRQKSRMPASA